MTDIEQIKQEVSDITHEFDRKVAMQVIDYLHSRGYLGGVPNGWQLVPKNPTREMVKAAWKAQYLYVGGNEETCETLAESRVTDEYQSKMDNVAYKSMLSAAPEPPQDRKD